MILLLTQNFPPDPGGIETLMGGMARALAESGREVLVLADHIRGRGLGEPVYPSGLELRRYGGPRPLRRLVKAFAARRALARHPVEAVIADSWKSLEALPHPRVPTLVLAHGMEFPRDPSARKRGRIERALAKADAVAANSAFTAGLVRAFLPGGAPPLSVVLPPIEAQPGAGEADRVAVAELRGAGPLILSLARLEPRKGVDMVIRAIPALAARHPYLRHAVAGGGEDLPRLRALAAELGVSERVHFLGRVEAGMKSALLGGADLFAMPVRREGNSVEGFGLVYLEAAWHGLPALAGRDGGAAEAVADGDTGRVCDGADPAAVEAALAGLLEDSALRRRMGEAAAQRARAEFTWDAVLPRYLALLNGGAR
ncbi:glycosyltransferase family 4 protein [Pararoseomonas indoligenes]|uniref:Glycosyltransferase family 4 protein n=1 Tax=Roseomonas indoligenes TaxID=2820811 RepID=A0A940MUX5_9PROT|nr:glycosyltransferase family 4 protein [Pararoseomonas indoligenes]MBP0491400.1 glycosyltransferase family 4 protein [Pararoseomonas indoligenes]